MCVGGLKTFLYSPQKIVSVCGGGLKTETGKLHEILTSVCVGGLKTLYPRPPKIVSVCVWGGLKIETGKFLLHFQNSQVE